jgi:hypothetical protein
MADDDSQRRMLLLMRDELVVERIKRSLLRKNIWCAPCPRREDLAQTLSIAPFSAVLLDFDDPAIDADAALPSIASLDPGLTRIALTKRIGLRSELDGLAEHVLLQPLDMVELISAVMSSPA